MARNLRQRMKDAGLGLDIHHTLPMEFPSVREAMDLYKSKIRPWNLRGE
jgi:hypothetical protein